MKYLLIAGVVILILSGLAMYRPGRAASPESAFIVTFSDAEITVAAPNGEKRSVPWRTLTKVAVRTTDEGPWQPDVFWGLHTGGKDPALVFPGGATGEAELIEAMQHRLHGFRNEELIKAMGSTSNAFFVIWESEHAQAK